MPSRWSSKHNLKLTVQFQKKFVYEKMIYIPYKTPQFCELFSLIFWKRGIVRFYKTNVENIVKIDANKY